MNVRAIAALAATAGAAVSGAVLANAAVASAAPPLVDWFEGDKSAYFWRGHRVAYTSRGAGRPVVLLHGIHAAASSYEWRKNFEQLATRFRVVAVDLLGFGMSDRPAIDYDAQVYVALLADFLRDVFDEPACVVASSLSCAYAIEVAANDPERVDRLVLVCPTGINRLDEPVSAAGAITLAALRAPVVGESLYNILVSEASINYYLRNQVFADPASVDRAIVDQMYATSHRPGARYAPAAFVGGVLNLDVRQSFARLTNPALIVWGAKAEMAPASDAMEFALRNPNVRIETAAGTGLLPHDEKAEWFNVAAGDFLA